MTANRYSIVRCVLPTVLIASALYGCSSRPSVPPGPHPGLAIFNQAINQPVTSVTSDTIVREGDDVSYMVVSSPETPVLVRFNVSCSGAAGSMFYETASGMSPFSESPTTTELPQAQLDALRHSEQLRTVCEQRAVPEWRVLDDEEGKDWLLIDRKGAQIEDGVLKAWTGKHFFRQQQNGTSRTPFSHERERLAISCDEQTLKVASHFALNDDLRVLNGWLRSKDELKPVKEASPDHQALYKAICEGDQPLSSLPALKPRTSLPVHISTPKVSPKAIADIEALGMPAPRLSMKKITYRFDAVLFNGARFNDSSKQDFISVDEKSGQILVQPIDVAEPQVRLTFRGLFELARRTIDEKTGKEVEVSDVTGVRFTGNWRDLPSNTDISYTLTRTRETANGPTSHENTVTCRIGIVTPAANYLVGLQGTAKPVNCIKMKTARMEWSERLIYLSDYGLFLTTHENSVVGKWTWRIESVE